MQTDVTNPIITIWAYLGLSAEILNCLAVRYSVYKRKKDDGDNEAQAGKESAVIWYPRGIGCHTGSGIFGECGHLVERSRQDAGWFGRQQHGVTLVFWNKRVERGT